MVPDASVENSDPARIGGLLFCQQTPDFAMRIVGQLRQPLRTECISLPKLWDKKQTQSMA
jgi:hypothetical protein